MRASGQLAVRRTGPSTVHLVATAFGPLGGDDAEISLVVEEGATLDVRSVAAAVALPRRGGGQTSALQLEPTVVTARAHHLAEVTADLGASGELTATEQVLLGRWAGEDRARSAGPVDESRTSSARGPAPSCTRPSGLGPGEPAWLPPVAPRAYASLVHLAK